MINWNKKITAAQKADEKAAQARAKAIADKRESIKGELAVADRATTLNSLAERVEKLEIALGLREPEV